MNCTTTILRILFQQLFILLSGEYFIHVVGIVFRLAFIFVFSALCRCSTDDEFIGANFGAGQNLSCCTVGREVCQMGGL